MLKVRVQCFCVSGSVILEGKSLELDWVRVPFMATKFLCFTARITWALKGVTTKSEFYIPQSHSMNENV